MDVKIEDINKLSDRLREIVNKAKPQRGQTTYFRSIRPNSRGTSVIPMDLIYDPWGGPDGKGAEVTIAYISGVSAPKELGEKPTPILGRIQFRKMDNGNSIAIRGGNSSDEKLFQYLFLTNQNLLTRNKSILDALGLSEDESWYIPNTKGPAFTMDLPAKKAEDVLELERDYRDATRIIDEMPDDHLEMFAVGLGLTGIRKGATPDEIRVAMIQQVARKNPRTIITLHDNDTVKVRILIDRAQRKGIIKKTQNDWVMLDTDKSICFIPPATNPDEILRDYLLSPKGKETREFLDDVTADMRKERTAGRPKGAKNKAKTEAA